MSTCKGCKDSCPDQPCSKPLNKVTSQNKEDLTYIFKERREEKLELFSLYEACDCTTYIALPRHACLDCLRRWSKIASETQIEEMINKLQEEKHPIAVERLTNLLKEKKLKNTKY